MCLRWMDLRTRLLTLPASTPAVLHGSASPSLRPAPPVVSSCKASFMVPEKMFEPARLTSRHGHGCNACETQGERLLWLTCISALSAWSLI